jgi:hypothetical protein
MKNIGQPIPLNIDEREFRVSERPTGQVVEIRNQWFVSLSLRDELRVFERYWGNAGDGNRPIFPPLVSGCANCSQQR